jgi:hypothetical protein
MAATDDLMLVPAAAALHEWRSDLYDWKDEEDDRQFEIVSSEHATLVLEWLSRYGQHLLSLSMLGFPQPLQQLPCCNLEELYLEDCVVQLGPAADGQPGVILGCSKLTCLELSCKIMDAPQGAEVDGSLSTLVHLQNLVILPFDVLGREYSVNGLSQATLPQLTQLTHLNIKSLSRANLAQLAGLTSLQKLQLQESDEFIIGPSSVPGLVVPASLTRLDLRCSERVEAEQLLFMAPVGLEALSLQGPGQRPGSLLSCIPRFQQLTQLAVALEDWPPAGPMYSALTASSDLKLLGLSYVVPGGIWQHMFPATRKLLDFEGLVFVQSQGARVLPSPMGAADVCGIVSCCPNMHTLHSVHLQHGPHVSELRKLTGLTRLNARYAGSDLAAAEGSLRSLAAVTQLVELEIILGGCPRVSMAPLLPLTSLIALTSLKFRCCLDYHPFDAKFDDDERNDAACLHVALEQVSHLISKCREGGKFAYDGCGR